MRRIWFGLAVISAHCAPLATAHAQDIEAPAAVAPSENLELARRVIEASGWERQLDAAMVAMRSVLVASVIGNMSQTADGRLATATIERFHPGGIQAFSEQFADRFTQRFKTYYPQMLDEAAASLAGLMARNELSQTIAFLESETGQSWVRAALDSQSRMEAAGERYGILAGTDVGKEMFEELQSRADENLEPSQ